MTGKRKVQDTGAGSGKTAVAGPNGQASRLDRTMQIKKEKKKRESQFLRMLAIFCLFILLLFAGLAQVGYRIQETTGYDMKGRINQEWADFQDKMSELLAAIRAARENF